MKTPLRAIIIDDERLARNDLRAMLGGYEGIEIVGEADCAGKATQLIRQEDPDLLFLDIQMPGESGFDLLDAIDIRAQVIFVTAFDEYAFRAFEVDATDYLLKPVNPERLKAAIERASRSDSPAPARQDVTNYDDALLVTINSHKKFLRVDSIVYIQSAGDYSEIITSDGKKGLVQKSMSEWQQRLPTKHFCRIHRSTIVNIEYVTTIDKGTGSSYQVCLKGIAVPLTMSRRRATALQQRRQ